ncbi:MAG: filamentous hemagglutinin N-terminal domain-containing protein [Xenococcaceae cyanobacterium MO_188.B19]|nr:filamentous hemagglutinin N-terminal domain-containing protein [Xenococcaceae cyanobacterium MO_188.B19]
MQPKFPLYCASLLAIFCPLIARSQVSPDNTLPQNSVIVNQGNILQINGGTEVNTNLFHSFEQFSITEGQTAWFNNNLAIENIFSRVTGGEVSDINGLIKANGSANLFLINPNGIIFGKTGSLDIGGSFFATTADSIVFNDNLEFSATNPQEPPLLTINIPLGVQYGSNNTESVIESYGNLQVSGDLTFAANNLTLTGTLESGNNLFLEAQNNINISDSVNLAFKAIARNNLFITGENLINISALNNSDSGLFSGGNMTLTSPNAIEGNINYWSNGNFSINTLDGSNGSLTSSDNIQIYVGGNVNFADYIGSSLHIFAGGSVNIESITINGSSEKNSLTETVTLSNGTISEIDSSIKPTLDVRAGVIAVQDPLGIIDALRETNSSQIPTSADINIQEITIAKPDGLVFLSNQYQSGKAPIGNMEVGIIRTNDRFGGFSGNSGDVIIDSRSGIIFPGGELTFDINTRIVIQNSGIEATSYGTGDVGEILLLANETIALANSAVIGNSILSGSGNGADINIRARTVSLTGGSSIITTTLGEGAAGNLTVNASDSVELSGIAASASLTSILASQTAGSGEGGNLTINTGKLIVKDGGFISSSTFGEHPAGKLTVNASEFVKLTGTWIDPNGTVRSGGLFAETSGSGNAGDLEIETPRLIIQDGAVVLSGSFAEGEGGDLTIIASDSVELSGIKDGNISGLFASTQGAGDAGDLRIETEKLIVRDGAEVVAKTFAEGEGGDLTVIASDSVELINTPVDAANPTGLFTDTEGTGNAGDLRIETRDLIVRDGAAVVTSSFAEGNAGDIFLKVSNNIILTGNKSGIFASAESSSEGNAGDILTQNQTPNRIEVKDGAVIAVNSEGSGIGGSTNLSAGELILDNGTITAKTASNQGGDINLNIDGNLQLTNSGEISATGGTAEAGGDGGNITINSDFILAFPTENKHQITAEAFEGDGGNININTNSIFGRDNINISASSKFGLDGTISINTPDVDPASSLVKLPDVPVDVSALLARNICDIGRGKTGNNSSFIDTGRGGLPTSPYEPLDSNNIFVDVQLPTEWREKSTTNSSVLQPATKPIIEASAWVVNEKGNVELVSQLASKNLGCR